MHKLIYYFIILRYYAQRFREYLEIYVIAFKACSK